MNLLLVNDFWRDCVRKIPQDQGHSLERLSKMREGILELPGEKMKAEACCLMARIEFTLEEDNGAFVSLRRALTHIGDMIPEHRGRTYLLLIETAIAVGQREFAAPLYEKIEDPSIRATAWMGLIRSLRGSPQGDPEFVRAVQEAKKAISSLSNKKLVIMLVKELAELDGVQIRNTEEPSLRLVS